MFQIFFFFSYKIAFNLFETVQIEPKNLIVFLMHLGLVVTQHKSMTSERIPTFGVSQEETAMKVMLFFL